MIREAQARGREVETDYGISMGGQYAKVDGLRERLHRIVRDIEDLVNEELRQ
jgi:hypothetical protein